MRAVTVLAFVLGAIAVTLYFMFAPDPAPELPREPSVKSQRPPQRTPPPPTVELDEGDQLRWQQFVDSWHYEPPGEVLK